MVLLSLVLAKENSSDSDLIDSYIEQIAVGDTEALGLLYHHTKASVYSYALSVMKDTHDAEDILHDCYVKLYSAAKDYISQGKPMAWIITITKNLCLKRLKEKKNFTDETELDPEKELEFSADVSEDDRILIRECLRKLSDDERRIVVLHAVSGFLHREIAEFMNIPLSTVISKYNRAIAKLEKSFMGGKV
ncbi:MAG: RNA polymerase sigma factor [Ruminococcaceae bacterium]|nr:RNA polymerase sigma factor [Oscillospiraceae bacterium]